jgi:hypothetical protein
MRYESLASRIALLDDKGTLSVSKKYLETWNKIADRYNLPHFVDTTIKTETNKETKVDTKCGRSYRSAILFQVSRYFLETDNVPLSSSNAILEASDSYRIWSACLGRVFWISAV